MDFENKYPYTDFHELNLDWILNQMKALATAWDAYQEQLTGTNGEWPTFKNYIETSWTTYQANLTGPNGEWPTFKAYMENAWQQYQNSLTGVGGEWPTFKATMEGEWQAFFDNYLQTLGVVQTTGQSITNVMSQKASSDELIKKTDCNYSLLPISYGNCQKTSGYSGDYKVFYDVTSTGYYLIALDNYTNLNQLGVIRGGSWNVTRTPIKINNVGYYIFSCVSGDKIAAIPVALQTININYKIYEKSTDFEPEEIYAGVYDLYTLLKQTYDKAAIANVLTDYIKRSNSQYSKQDIQFTKTSASAGDWGTVLTIVDPGYYLVSFPNVTNLGYCGVVRNGTWAVYQRPVINGDTAYFTYECQAGDKIGVVANVGTTYSAALTIRYKAGEAFNVNECVALSYDFVSYVAYNENKIKQTTGSSTTDTMSQKAITDLITGFLSNKWYGKNALVIGDSLTAANKWQLKLNTELGMNVTTHAKGGAGIIVCVDGNGGDFAALNATDVAGKDLIIFYAGYNDRGIVDGDVGDLYPTDNTIAGRIQYALNKIYSLLGTANNLKCQVLLITPHCGGKYQWINADGYDYYPANTTQTLGTLADTEEAVAHQNNIPVINLWKNSGINKFTWDVFQASATAQNTNYVEYEIDSDGNVIGTVPLHYVNGNYYYQWRNGVVVYEQYTGSSPYPYNNDQLHMNDDGYAKIGEMICGFITALK